MAKKICLLFCFWLVVVGTYAQDIITRTDGAVIRAQVLEIKPGQVNFRMYQQPDTLVYQISVQDVQSITMADGTTRTFNQPGAQTGKKSIAFNYETQFGRNMLWFYPLDLLFTNFTMAYERVLASGKISFRIPLVLGLGSDLEYNDYYDFRKSNLFGTGLEVNFFPYGQGKLQYYLGPSIHYRSYRAYYYNDRSTQPQPGLEKANSSMYTIAVKNGVYYHFSWAFIISADVGLGLRIFDVSPAIYAYRPNTRVYIPGNLHVGIRF